MKGEGVTTGSSACHPTTHNTDTTLDTDANLDTTNTTIKSMG